jgi:hypothetical protein
MEIDLFHLKHHTIRFYVLGVKIKKRSPNIREASVRTSLNCLPISISHCRSKDPKVIRALSNKRTAGASGRGQGQGPVVTPNGLHSGRHRVAIADGLVNVEEWACSALPSPSGIYGRS